MTINTRVIKLFLRELDQPFVPLPDGLRLQVLPSMAYLPTCQKHHFAAFVQDSAMLIVWDDEPKHLLTRGQNIERQLMQMIWTEEGMVVDEKKTGHLTPQVNVAEVSVDNDSSDYSEEQAEKPRKTVLIQAVISALTMVLIFAALGSGWRKVAIEIMSDGGYIRLAFVAVVPAQIWLALVRE